MKVLLQDMDTFRFLAGEEQWTISDIEAFDFGQVIQALDYALSHRLQNVRPVIKCSDSSLDVELPSIHSTE